MSLLDAVKSWVYGPPASSYLPPVRTPERKYTWTQDPGVALAASVGPLVHGPGAYPWGQRERADLASANSAVYACLRAIARSYAEAPLRHYRGEGDERRVVPDSPLARLLRHPNPHFSLRTIEQYTQHCLHVHGNAYWRKLRAGDPQTGRVAELWPVSPLRMTPMRERGSSGFIDFYRYQLSWREHEDIPVDNVVHFRLGLDDRDHRLGLAPLRHAAREVSSDEEATRFAAYLLGNGAFPGAVVTIDKEMQLSREDAAALSEEIAARFGGDNRGKAMVLKGANKFDRVAFSPDELDLTNIHRNPEVRICAVMGVPAIVAGVWAGLERATYANYGEAREAFYDGTIIPLYQDNAATLNLQLVPDFTDRDDEYLEYDLSDVRALQEDEDRRYERLTVAVQGGWLLPDEARAELGLPPLPAPTPAGPRALPAAASLAPVAWKAAAPAPDPEATHAALLALRAAAEGETARAIREYLGGQRLRVKRAIREAAS